MYPSTMNLLQLLFRCKYILVHTYISIFNALGVRGDRAATEYRGYYMSRFIAAACDEPYENLI